MMKAEIDMFRREESKILNQLIKSIRRRSGALDWYRLPSSYLNINDGQTVIKMIHNMNAGEVDQVKKSHSHAGQRPIWYKFSETLVTFAYLSINVPFSWTIVETFLTDILITVPAA